MQPGPSVLILRSVCCGFLAVAGPRAGRRGALQRALRELPRHRHRSRAGPRRAARHDGPAHPRGAGVRLHGVDDARPHDRRAAGHGGVREREVSWRALLDRPGARRDVLAAAPSGSPTPGAARWSGFGQNLSNTRFQPAASAGIAAADVPRLKLKWAFGLPGDVQSWAAITLQDGRLYVGSIAGNVYSLDARTGCVHWAYDAGTIVRTAVNVGRIGAGDAARGRGVLRRRSRQHARGGRAHRAAVVEGQRRVVSLRAAHRAPPSCTTDGCMFRSRPARKARARCPTTSAAGFAAASWRSTRPAASRSGRATRFRRSRCPCARTRVARSSGGRRARRSGPAPSSTRRAARCM